MDRASQLCFDGNPHLHGFCYRNVGNGAACGRQYHRVSVNVTVWGGPPGPRPTPWSASSLDRPAGRGRPARTKGSAPHQKFTSEANDTGSRLAPPTSAPSISVTHISAVMVSVLKMPPYRIRLA